MKTLSRFVNSVPVLVSIMWGFALYGAATEPANSPLILIENAENWHADVFCGNPHVRTFVPGRKPHTALWGRLTFDSTGNAYVASETFVAIVTAAGKVDILTGQPKIAGSLDGPPGVAAFGNAIDIARVNDDLLYVVDAANFTLRRLARRDGRWFTKTVAGVPGKKGHRDGPGHQVLFEPVFDSVAATTNGVVYLFSGDYIRKFENGVVTTLNNEGKRGYVNGPLKTASFYHGHGRRGGLALDGRGNLYVADKMNIAVRKVDLINGVVTTFAGRQPGQPRTRPRDGTASDSRFYSIGGPTTLVYDSTRNWLFVHSDDERWFRVVRPSGNGWEVRTMGIRDEPHGNLFPTLRARSNLPGFARNAGVPGRTRLIDGLPAAVDAQGNLYLINYKSRQNQILVVREEGAK